ncbi:PilW family protein [Spongiibacter marinus]|uniref:PilW family protein n=1 Tax=Spongiibacter marinus TaxID=354246 RepID=UPI001F21AF8B|nr:PilW family protein [Spongiibacter marinus]
MIQENARFAMAFLGKEIRMAGYMGCSSVGNIEPNVIAKPASDVDFIPVVGQDNVAAGHERDAVPGTDVIRIKRGSDETIKITGNLSPNNANVQIENNSIDIKQNDYVLIADCSTADIFRVTNSPKGEGKGKTTLAHASSNNSNNRLSKIYSGDAEIFGFETTHFFVRDTGRKTAGGSPVYALYSQHRGLSSGGAEEPAIELVEGIENLQLSYGLDTSGDRAVDEYKAADAVADWLDVVSVRVELTLVGNDENIVGEDGDADAQTVTDRDGNTIANGDGRMRQVFTSVFALRNRLP